MQTLVPSISSDPNPQTQLQILLIVIGLFLCSAAFFAVAPLFSSIFNVRS